MVSPRTLLKLAALALWAAVIGFAPAQAQEYWVEESSRGHLSSGFRLGGYVFADEDLEDIYGGLGVFGLDLKYHLGDSPIAIQTSVDFAGGDGDLDDEPTVLESDADLHIFNWRLSLVLEPPPGYWGDPDTGFSVIPYLGGGIGYQYLREDIEVLTTDVFVDARESESAFGYHAFAGIDFLFDGNVSAGFEVLYTGSDAEGVLDRLDYDGFVFSGSLKFYY